MRVSNNQSIELQRALFRRALEVVVAKRSDYGGDSQPFANLYASQVVGVEPWRGALVRLLDKVSRLRTLAERGGLAAVREETLVDTAIDALNYVVLAFLLVLEAMPEDRAAGIVALLGEEPC